MAEFEFSFKNKYLKMWFLILLPLIFLILVIMYFVPFEYQWIPSLLGTLAAILFFGWVRWDKRKLKRK